MGYLIKSLPLEPANRRHHARSLALPHLALLARLQASAAELGTLYHNSSSAMAGISVAGVLRPHLVQVAQS